LIEVRNICTGYGRTHKQLIPNYIVTVTNLYGLVAFYSSHSLYERLLIANAIIGSILCHLADTNRGLIGVKYLNRHPLFWLNYDRVSVILLFVYTYLHNLDKLLFVIQSTPYAIIGIICLLISETHWSRNISVFVVSHSLWHIFAFHCLYLTV
jgi:hypothetical protein